MNISLLLKRKFQLLALLTLAFLGALNAQTVVTVGTGTTTNTTTSYPAPYGNYYWGARHQFIITQAELNALGVSGINNITKLAFNVSAPASITLIDFTIKLKNTTQSAFSTPALDDNGLTTVFGPTSYTDVSGWNTHVFSTPFVWNGTSNLLVDVCFNNTSWISNGVVFNSTTSFVSSAYRFSDATGNCSGPGTTTSSIRPNMQLTVVSANSGPPQPPIANFYAPDTVWINSPATLINTSSFQSRVFWDFPNENPLQTGYFRQAGYIDTAKYSNNITYTFTSPGLKLVKLLAVNNLKRDSLRDSITKYIYVDTPSQAPIAQFITFKRIMGITEEAPFIDISSNGPTQWDWTIDPPCISCITDPANGIANYFVTGSGQPGNTVASPRLAAFDPGVFKVCLRVWNLRGTDSICKNNYIKVVEGNYMCSGSGGFSSTKEEGFLYGISGPYQTYARSSWPSNCPGFTINPCADSITLFVERIKMWPSDSIIIYNGPDNTSPKLITIGAGPTGQVPLTAAQSLLKGGNAIHFRYKPGSVALPPNYDSASFIIRWLAKPASYPKPVSRLEMPDTVYSTQLISYEAKSTGTLMKYSWDVDGNGAYDSISTNPKRTYIISVPSLRNVCLVTYNCVGYDTTCKQVAFLPINRPPIARFTVDKNIAFNTDTIRFKDQTANGVASWRWTFIPGNVQYLNGTSSSSQNPQVRLTSPTQYTVRLTATNAFGVDSITKTFFIQINAYQTPGNGATFASVADATMGINRVRLAGIDSSFTNVTGPSYQYITSISQVGNMYRGGKYAIVLNRPKAGTNLDYKVWIDLNYNANFETNELVLNKINNGDEQISDTLTISSTQPYGNTRMRVGVDLANSTQFNSVYGTIGLFKDFNVSVKQDLVKPTINLNGPTVIRTEINKLFADPLAAAFDNIEGNISSRIQKISTVDTANIGVYNVKYFVTDYSGNTSDTVYRTVIVELNSTGPSITLIGLNTLRTNVKETFNDPGVIALDNTGNVITSNVITTGTVNTNIIGTYTRRYTITDAFNFTRFVERTIIVQDTTKPVITPKESPYLHQVGTVFNPIQAINWSDNYNSKTQLNPTYVGILNENIIGTYFIVYNLVDESNNSARELRLQVNVTDKIKPTIEVTNNPLYVEVNETFDESDVVVNDNYWPLSALYRNQTSNVKIDSLGTYQITYFVTDGSGNVNSIVRTVIVKDTKAPTIKLVGLSTVNLERWNTYIEPGVQIFDNYNSDAEIRKNLVITSNLPINSNGDYFGNVEGLYTVQYKVRDVSNNISETYFRTINVIANTTSVIENSINANNILSIYPNPNNGIVKVKLFGNNKQEVNVKIYNSVGSLAKTLTIENNDLSEKQIDLSAFANGVYLVQVESAGKVYTHKISVIK